MTKETIPSLREKILKLTQLLHVDWFSGSPKELTDVIMSIIAQRDEACLGEEKVTHSISWNCKNCKQFGGEGEFCRKCGKKITEKKDFPWETMEQKASNQKRSEIKQNLERSLE